MDVALLQQPSPHRLAGTALKEHIIRHHYRRPAVYLDHGLYMLEEVELLVGCCGPEVLAGVGYGLPAAYLTSIEYGAALRGRWADWL